MDGLLGCCHFVIFSYFISNDGEVRVVIEDMGRIDKTLFIFKNQLRNLKIQAFNELHEKHMTTKQAVCLCATRTRCMSNPCLLI